MNAVIRIKKILIKSTISVANIALLGMMLMIIVEIIMRYVFGVSTMVSTDFAAYGLGITFYWGAAKSFDEGAFVRMDVMFDLYKGKIKKILIVLFDFIIIFFNCNITYFFGILLYNTIIHNVKAINIYETPLVVPRSIMFVGMILFSLYLICRTIEDINNPIEPHSNRELRKIEDENLKASLEAAAIAEGKEMGAIIK